MKNPEHLTLNGKEYAILRLLGRGKGGYTYLAERDGIQYALKQIHHEPCDYYQFGDKLAAELRDYEKLTALNVPIPALLDVDRDQERLLKELLPGETVYQLVLRNALEPWCLERTRALSQALRAAGLNIDWFPTNFIPRDGTLYYVDYECNPYMDQWSFETWGVTYWSRTPEFDAYAREHGDLCAPQKKGPDAMKQEKSCGAVIFREENTQCYYLVIQSTQGHTTLCKGHVEKNETEHETAVREIMEETGLTVDFLDGFRQVITYSPYRGCTKDVVFFLARVTGGTLACQPEEVADARFLPFDGALAALTHTSDRTVLQEAHRFLQSR